MKKLICLSGIPASGKSTFLKENNLESYAICPDKVRQQLTGLITNEHSFTIDQNCNKKVFEIIEEMLRYRMSNGYTVIIDATCCDAKNIKLYNKLCSEYGYRKAMIKFDIDLEETIKRDGNRKQESQVGENVIRRFYESYKNMNPGNTWEIVSVNDWKKVFEWRTEDVNNYDHVNVIGDIHGCIKPLDDFFESHPFSEKELYVFVGDLLDRGSNNKEVLSKMIELSKLDNVVICEGNHEGWLKEYALGDYEPKKDYVKKTIEEISDMDKNEIKLLTRCFKQLFRFTYKDKEYLVTHGGLSFVPELTMLLPLKQVIQGVGQYSLDIDFVYKENALSDNKNICHNVIQIHGHRNSGVGDGNELSVNLEGSVENGGYLKVWRDGNIEYYKNPIEQEDFTNSFLIKSKSLENGITSYNFTRDAFTNSEWNTLTTKARGLFMKDGKVVARGYHKFFNIGEQPETEWESLTEKEGEVVTFVKENGFLGILSYIDGDLHFFSKSTDQGEHVQYFKNIFYQKCKDINVVKKWLSENNYSLVFEIIDIKNDPHIVEYKENDLILLDAIKNDLDFDRLSYSTLLELSNSFGIEAKKVFKKFNSFKEFKEYINNYDQENAEGVVAECDNFMTKFKFPWYKYWKYIRGQKERYLKGWSYDKENQDVKNMISLPELSNKSIIEIRNSIQFKKQDM